MYIQKGSLVVYKPKAHVQLKMGLVLRGPVYSKFYDAQAFWLLTETGIKLVSEDSLNNSDFEKFDPTAFMAAAAVQLDEVLPHNFDDIPEVRLERNLSLSYVQNPSDFDYKDKARSGDAVFFATRREGSKYELALGIVVGVLPHVLIVAKGENFVYLPYEEVVDALPRYKAFVRKLDQFLQRNTANVNGV